MHLYHCRLLSSIIITFLILLTPAAGEIPPKEKTRGSLTLEQALEAALEHNKELLISKTGVRRQKHRVNRNLNFLPSVTLEGVKTLKEKLAEVQLPPLYPGAFPETTTIDFTQKYEFGLQVIQPLFAGGKLLYSYKNARLDLAAAREKQQFTRREIIFQVKKVFLDILLMKELLITQKETLELARENVKKINEKYLLGMASKYELLRAELSVQSIPTEMLETEKNLKLAYMELELITGIPEATVVDIEGEPDDSRKHLDTALLVEKALGRSPEIRRMEIQGKKNKNLLKMAYGRFLPEISLVAGYRFRSDYFNFKNNNWDNYYTLHLAFRLPIFERFRRFAQIGELKAVNQVLSLRLQQLHQRTRMQVQQLVQTLKKEYHGILAGRKNIETAREGARVARLTYNEGLITALELDASVNSLAKARTLFLQAVYNYNIASHQLEKITGITLSTEKERP